jgi:hypothetical protein
MNKKKILQKYCFIPCVVAFALIGMFNVGQDLNSFMLNNQHSREVSPVAGGDSPLEINDPNNNLFLDGHISSSQTRSISKFSKFMGVEPYGGEKTIRNLMENVADVHHAPYAPEDIPYFWDLGGFGWIWSIGR